MYFMPLNYIPRIIKMVNITFLLFAKLKKNHQNTIKKKLNKIFQNQISSTVPSVQF